MTDSVNTVYNKIFIPWAIILVSQGEGEWVGGGRKILLGLATPVSRRSGAVPPSISQGWKISSLFVPANTTDSWESGCCPWLGGEVDGRSASCSVSVQLCRRRVPLACDYSRVGISINCFLLGQFQGTGIAWIFLCLFVCFCLWVLEALGWNLLQPRICGKQ